MIEAWLNEPDYETRTVGYEAKVLFGVVRKDGTPMTEADADALLAEAEKHGGILERDEEIEDEDDEDGMKCFYAYVDFEVPVHVSADNDHLTDAELKDNVGDEADDYAAEKVVDMFGSIYKQYDFKWGDFDYNYY